MSSLEHSSLIIDSYSKNEFLAKSSPVICFILSAMQMRLRLMVNSGRHGLAGHLCKIRWLQILLSICPGWSGHICKSGKSAQVPGVTQQCPSVSCMFLVFIHLPQRFQDVFLFPPFMHLSLYLFLHLVTFSPSFVVSRYFLFRYFRPNLSYYHRSSPMLPKPTYEV